MILSKSCQYSVRALLHIVQNDKDTKTDITKIARELSIPQPYLAKIMQQMVKNGLVRSSKGPNGGFYMTPKERKRNLLHVIEAVDGLDYFNQCALGMKKCENKNPCPLHNHTVKSREAMMTTYRNFNIERVGLKVRKGEFCLS